MIRKVLLKCGLSPGDITMLTAAVRDLHACYPNQFRTDVRTSCNELWENNPHLTPLSETDPEVEHLDCSYPLIDYANEAPYHCLHGFIAFLNERLSLSIRPTKFKGDIHLSKQEKAWHSQVRELTGENTPYWIISGGGKHDITIKWWESARYQKVVDHFQGKILFVQIGDLCHHHPKLEGTIDLRGKTNLRQLVRLIYHAQGVLCPVTSLMHLAAAVETPTHRPKNRACVVVAGGREPAHWEAYPDHQFIHTNGVVSCSSDGGCWKDRVAPLRDGDHRDKPGHLCLNVVNRLPRCMDLIQPEEVIRRIELYYQGGMLRYLTRRQSAVAERGVSATLKNNYDLQPLTLSSAGLACEEFIGNIPAYPNCFNGRGIIICGGGVRYFTNAWVCINILRHLGCKLPVQVWHLGRKEMSERMKNLLAPLGVECVDGDKIRKKVPMRILNGWELKPYAILQSPFREVLLLDADNVPVVNPEFLFETRQFRENGAVFWPDYGNGSGKKTLPVWKSCGLRPPAEPEFESGQIVLDKARTWAALRLCLWLNENSDFYYDYLHGDKETFHVAFRKLKQPYALAPHPIHPLTGTMCQHDFEGRRIFQHRNMAKWEFSKPNLRVKDFWLESECRRYLSQLKQLWDGRIN